MSDVELQPVVGEEECNLRTRRPAFSIDSILSQKMTTGKSDVTEHNGFENIVKSPSYHEDRLPVLSRRYKVTDNKSRRTCNCDKCQNDGYGPIASHLFDDDFENQCYPSYFQGNHVSEESLNLKYSHFLKDDNQRFNKRRRTIFTSSQLERLEYEFQQQQYIVGQERRYLARQLGLNEIQVKVWFQNRRIKWRKYTHGTSTDAMPELPL